MISTVPLHKRPVFQGLFGAVFGVASVAGPLLGGVFTTEVSWRWCFYINLPIGAVTIAVIAFILQINETKKVQKSLKEQFIMLDPIGTLCFLPSITCLLLALQWGGATYAWNSWRIILLFVIFGITAIAFGLVQYLTQKTTATIPGRVITQRSVAFACVFTFCVGSALMLVVFYLPIWFQAIKGDSAVQSGIKTIPTILALVVAAISSGILVQKFGYYTPFMYLSAVVMSIGAGMLTTFTVSTSSSAWIGYQVLFGLGAGFGMQQSNLAVQACLPRKDVPTGSAIIFFFQNLGGALFVSVGQNVFLGRLIPNLTGVGNIDPAVIVNTGATALRGVVDPSKLDAVLHAYNAALMGGPMIAAVVVACLAILGAVGVEWKSVKQNMPAAKKAAAAAEKADPETGDMTPPRTAEVESPETAFKEKDLDPAMMGTDGFGERA